VNRGLGGGFRRSGGAQRGFLAHFLLKIGSGRQNKNEYDQQRSESRSPRVRIDGDEVCPRPN